MPIPDDRALVELQSDDRSDYLRLRVIARQRDVYPSIELAVDAHVRDFSGRSSVWVGGDALKDFVAALRDFERTRTGRVVLESMDPHELRLSFSSLDLSGHVLVEFTLLRHVLVGARPRNLDIQISGGLELEPSSLPGLVSAFQSMIAAPTG
jgi:hypothetical protein